MKKYLRTALALTIITATIVAFVLFIKGHPEVIGQIKQLPPITIIQLLLLYLAFFTTYVMITRVSLRIYHKTMSIKENFLFNAYSSLINFFGPGQSGPIFRGAYLKKRHNLTIKQFMFTMLIYFGFYAVLSAMLVVVGSRPWWQTALVALAVGLASLIFIQRYKRRSQIETDSGLNLMNIGLIFGATVLQILTTVFIYGLELQRVGAAASIGEILSYTGVTNLALFAAVTPSAIGIREAFLIFSQGLHHIDSTTIVAANLVDRSINLAFLGILFVVVLSMHAKDKLGVSKLKD